MNEPRKNQLAISAWLPVAIACIIALPPAAASAVESDEGSTLRGIGHRESKVLDGYNKLSLMGGAKLIIQSDGGLNDQAGSNYLKSRNWQIESAGRSGATEWMHPALTRDDEFYSKPTEGLLAFTTPSVMELFHASFDDFNGDGILPSGAGSNTIKIETSVLNADNLENEIQCEDGSKCTLEYNRMYTPLLIDVVPNQIYKDHAVDWWINTFAVDAYARNDDTLPMEELSFDGFLNNWEETIDKDTGMSDYQPDYLSAFSGDQKPNKQTVPRARFITGDSMISSTARHCNFAGDDCWNVRTHPKIESISESSGNTNGGQELTIKGWGFEHQDLVDVTVAGVACEVISTTMDEIKCTTGAAAGASIDGVTQVGQPGIAKRKYDPDNGNSGVDFNALDNKSHPMTEEALELVFEMGNTASHKAGWVWDGFFKAPATGEYRFYISCDDACQLKLDSSNPFSALTPFTTAVLAERFWNSAWRDYMDEPHIDDPNQYISQWIALTQDEFYKIEANHVQGSGEAHFTASVEFKMTSAASHPNSAPERQVLLIDQDNVAETWEVIITDPSDGQYKLVFQDPETLDMIRTEDVITADASADTFRKRIQDPYYNKIAGSSTTVTKETFDANGLPTSDSASIKTAVYKVHVDKRRTSDSFAALIVLKDGSNTSQIVVKTPQDVGGISSSAPLDGRYIINCPNPSNPAAIAQTREIGWWDWDKHIERVLTEDIPFLASKVIVDDLGVKGQSYWENARRFALTFTEMTVDMPQCFLTSGVNEPMTGSNVQFSERTQVEFGGNLMFAPIPMEMLYTATTKPQVLVNVDGLPAACANLNCDYLYANSVAEITAQSLSGNVLTIMGTSLPTEILEVRLGDVACGPVTDSTATQIECTLTKGPAAGTYAAVQVLSSAGLVPVNGASPIIVNLSTTNVTPSSGLNQNGGNVIAIAGSGMPQKKEHAKVTFSDNSKCTVIESTDSEIKCRTDGFDPSTADASSPYQVTVEVNAVSPVSDSNQSVMIVLSTANALSVSPNSVSPVLKQDLTITLVPDYPTISDLSTYSARVKSANDDSYERDLYIMSYDNTSKEMKVKFNGAPSGDYVIEIEGPGGVVGGPALAITTIIAVDDFQPRQGSVLGGTLITITGNHYGLTATDNPVKVGDNYCIVESTSDTEIICRILEAGSTVVSEAEVIVFAMASEEMVCRVDGGDGCIFSYQASTTTVSGMTASFDNTSNKIQLVVAGTGFIAGDLANTELLIDGKRQQCVDVTTTSATFDLVDALNTSSQNIQFYTAEGLPQGSISQINFSAGLISVSPTLGSSGGTLLTVSGVGFGTETNDVNLYHTPSGQNICSTTTVTAYGTFTCQTIAMEIASADELKLWIGGQYDCLNTASPADCSLTQEKATSPILTALAKTSDDAIELTGLNFPTDPEVSCMFKGVSGTATMLSSSSVSCTFAEGVAGTDTPVAPQLTFKDKITGVELTADADGQTLTNTVTIGTSLSGLSCSFAGGCTFTVSGNGIAGAISGNTDNKITVCENSCELDISQSTGSQAACKLPALATQYSATTFDIVQAGELQVSWSGTVSEPQKLNDGVNTKDAASSGSDCYAEVTAKEGYTFALDEVKIFLNNLLDKSPYTDGNLELQGSDDDGTTFTTIHAYGDEIHEGWNTLDWRAPASPQVFRTIRLQGSASGSCRFGEIKLVGVEVLADSEPTSDCTPKLTIDGVTTELSSVTYTGAITPALDTVGAVTPRYGSVLGSESVTFTGQGFSGTATVLIDNRPCAVDSQTTTSITCTTADRPFVPGELPSLAIYIDGAGFVATRGSLYRYVSRWTDTESWGGDIPPQEGDFVEIPAGRNLLVDVNVPEKLAAVLIYGSLIFAPDASNEETQRSFNAGYIMVNGGYLEVGTEEHPYTSKLTITMHGNKRSPYLPTYGNKVLAVRYGQLEMHGQPRSHVWTDLKETAIVGATTITLSAVNGIELDWKKGDKIVIASTDYEGSHAEERTILGVSDRTTFPVISLDKALEYEHYAGVQTFGSDSIAMRAEVGLLTRNVVYRGDPETSATNQYGAHIMLHSPGDETAVGRIENCEFFDVGQAFMLGRYPIHFHMVGTVQKSYIKKNSIHQTYNRATTLHGVHYLEISGNVAYKAMGHTIFIEDAVETKNLIENNLVVDTRASNSLLNTDQSPACFWITHPDNIFRGNHAAGSLRYGFWFDLQTTSIGPSFDPNVCPENSKLGEFSDNVAHSVGRYGLRIHHNLIPRTNPCQPLVADESNPSDPYHANPVIPAKFYRLTSYRNGRNGAIAERVGAVEFHDFKVADNKLAGIEMSLTSDMIDGYAKVVGGLIIGQSDNNEGLSDSSPHGIIGPRSEGFTIDGAKFFNYNWNEAAALGTCSHCFHSASTDSGARTVTTRNLLLDSTVTRKIKYQYPQRGIFHDEDGTLTGKGADTYATANHLHVQQENECELDEVAFDGVVCEPGVQVRRVAFYGYAPGHFRGQEMNILKYDRTPMKALSTDELQEYKDEGSNYARLFWKDKLNPSAGWAAPFITGHRYRLTWKNDLDFTKMKVMISERWQEEDLQTTFVLPFVDAREAINVTRSDTKEQIEEGGMLTKGNANLITGDNWLKNDTDIREFEFVVNGKNPEIKELTLLGLQCIAGNDKCAQDEIDDIPIDPNASYWSNDFSWPSGKKPLEGEDVHIEPGMNIILDIETPLLNLVIVNGRLSFHDDSDGNLINLKAKQVYVRSGELLIGNETDPYMGNAQITLHGERHEQTLVMSGSVTTGNKLLFNTALVSFHGKPRNRESRLRTSVYQGRTETYVALDLDWVAGDQLYFAPTNHQWTHSEYKTVVSYNSLTGALVVDSAFEFYHFGQDSSTADNYNGIDTRGEVRLLTRNVKVVGHDSGDKWGGNILTTDRMEFDGTVRYGTTQLDQVEVDKCSQENTFNAAIRFESTGESGNSYVKNSVVHGSQAWSLLITGSKKINIQSSDFIGAKAVGINLNSISDVTLDDLFIGDVSKREWNAGDGRIDLEAGVAFCSYWEPNKCYRSGITNSIAAGCAFAGFVAPGHDCGDSASSNKFRGNVAHSGERVGAHIYPDPAISSHSSCYEGSNFAAYKNRDGGLTTMYSTLDLRMRDMTFIDNQRGVCLQTAGERENIQISMTNVEIYGEDDNLDAPDGQAAYCADKWGLMLFGANRGGKALHPIKASSLPVSKIKSYGSWGAEIRLENVNFNNFQSSKTKNCNKRHSMIQRNPTASDYIPIHKFSDTTLTDVSDNAVVYLNDPNPGWANPTDCIEWPCTAPENVVLQFENTQYSGTIRPVKTVSNFQIVSDVKEAVDSYSGCQAINENWSAAWCANRNLGLLLFESLDSDNEDRTIQPVILTNTAKGYVNKANSMMDHGWDGFYTSQKRLSRFPMQLETDNDYDLEFTGTPASEMRYVLKAETGAIKIKIYYPNAGSYTVFANGVEKPYTPWNKDLGRHGELTKNQGCGENRYVGVENFLEFYITTDCEIKVVPRDAIMVSVRLEWTLEEFYAEGGVTTFTARMAAVLGVHASQIKTVAVYQGSVIIEFNVEADPEEEDPVQALNVVRLNFFEAVISNALNLGAPLMDATSDGRPVKTDYNGNHDQGKDGNLWDDLVIDRNNNNNGDNTNNNNGGSTVTDQDQNKSDSDNSGTNDQQNGNGQTRAIVTQTKIITDELESVAMTDTVKYLIVFLAVLSVALVFVIGYIAMRMCTRSREASKLRPELSRRGSQPVQDAQFVVAADDAKDIFSGVKKSRRKIIESDHIADGSVSENSSRQNSAAKSDAHSRTNLALPSAVSNVQMTTDGSAPDSARGLRSQRQ